jgi:TonB family protein
MEGQLITKVQPVYPGDAKQIQGTVVLKVIIDKQGNVSNIQAISGHPLLIPAAIEAVKQWKYKPFLVNGEPFEVETNVTVNFTLADKPPVEGVVGDMPGGYPPSEQDSTPNPAVPQRVRVSSGVAQALLVTKVPPQYPQEAKDQHIQGVVVMRVTVDKQGNVANIQLISGHPLLAPRDRRREAVEVQALPAERDSSRGRDPSAGELHARELASLRGRSLRTEQRGRDDLARASRARPERVEGMPAPRQTKVTPLPAPDNLHFSLRRNDAPQESQMGGDGCSSVPVCDVVRLPLGRGPAAY